MHWGVRAFSGFLALLGFRLKRFLYCKEGALVAQGRTEEFSKGQSRPQLAGRRLRGKEALEILSLSSPKVQALEFPHQNCLGLFF